MDELRSAWLAFRDVDGGGDADAIDGDARTGRGDLQHGQQQSVHLFDSARERRNAQQRERRARQRAQVQSGMVGQQPAAQPDSRVDRNARRREQRRRETEAERDMRLQKQRSGRRAKVARRREQDNEFRAALSARILTCKCVSEDEIRWMATNQHFLQDPRLALGYYYCCGTDPGSFVYGDEQLRGEAASATRDRVGKLLGDYPKPDDIAVCQRSVKGVESESTSIWACASCGRILLVNESEKVCFSSLGALRSSLMLSASEKEMLCGEIRESMAQRYRQLFFFGGDVYYLIPELVRDTERIPMCQTCYTDPRKSKFSVVSGHDYGRIGQLPVLNDVSLACVSPARCFGLELSLSGKHSSGHAICFPTNGPCELARVLPDLDSASAPRVTFIGPLETWRISRNKFLKLFSIPVDDVYEWLDVLAQVNDIFKSEGIEVDDSPRRRALLRKIELDIEMNVRVVDSAEVSVLDEEAASGFGERDTEVSPATAATSDVVFVRSSVVLPQVEQSDASVVHEIIDAMIQAVGGDAQHREPTVIPIKQARSPFVEWVDNAKILASVFPNLFLAGSAPLPAGPLPRDYVDHFLHYWDGRFEKSVGFTAMLFNQMQRHAAVQKAARVGATHGKTMERFGKLINTAKFREALAFAKTNPDSKEASRLNSGLLRLLSLVGGCVPFSPFERAATRPKLGAMRYRYGIALHWVTLAPPEHDDLLLHRVAQLREQGRWNDSDYVCVNKTCRFTDLPELIRTDARSRLAVSAMYPALSAQVFERRLKLLTHAIIRCRDSGATRASTSYLQTECGVYGRCAAFNAVIEPQTDGRLHAHMTVYGSTVSPSLLARAACSPELATIAARYIDSVSCLTTTARTRGWCREWKEVHGRTPRAFEIHVPGADTDYPAFVEAAERRVLATNIHSHSATCRKGVRGRSMCRLSRPAGVHEGVTQPLCVKLKRASVLGKRQRAEFSVGPVCGSVADCIDMKMDYDGKRIIRERAHGAIVWEQHRPVEDAMFVETNLPLACLASSHTNSAIMNGEDAGDMVEEYQQSYMTKEKGGLKCAAAVMHAALSDILKYPSVAEDSGTNLRLAKHLATRTVNAFSGGNEWSHSLMAYALSGYRSYLSSDIFWYVFPHKLVSHCEGLLAASRAEVQKGGSTRTGTRGGENNDGVPNSGDGEVGEGISAEGDVNDDRSINDELEEIASSAQADGGQVATKVSGCTNTGARMYRLATGKTVLLTQSTSYQHRGALFESYSPLEFEMIVDLLPRSAERERDPSQRGRPKRMGFDLGPDHPLAPHYQGFTRAKFRTPMLGGAPPPSLTKTGYPSVALSKYLLCLLTPWAADGRGPPTDMSPKGLAQLCKNWNSVSASFVNRQRYRYLHNVLQKRSRSFQNEKTCSEWRSRNADFWDVPIAHPLPAASSSGDPFDESSNADPMVSAEFFELTIAAAAKNKAIMNAVKALKADFWALVPDGFAEATVLGPHCDPIFSKHFGDGTSLSGMARSIHAMRALSDSNTDDEANVGDVGGGRLDELRGLADEGVQRMQCSADQRVVFDRVMESMDGGRRLRQTLTLLHGGGGTGKSTLIRRIVSCLKRHGIGCINTCPTGVGASHLQNGRTFHSAFKVMKSALSANDLENLRLTFTNHVWLIVVDEVSMLCSTFLVLLDTRLRAIYRSNLPFGGRSILLSGDFLQLKVTSGIALCKMFYDNSRTSDNLCARALFHQFQAFFLVHQHRAANCLVQQANLEACRALPAAYPTGSSWSESEKKAFRPLTDQVVQSITTELNAGTVSRDQAWLDEMTILVTSNFDKAVLTSCTAHLYARRNGRPVFRWKRALKRQVSPELHTVLYDEDANPELFAYFVAGAPAQVLDNNNGNVGWGVANGTPCRLHSLAWEDEGKHALVLKAVRDARVLKAGIVDLPFPPDFVNVQLLDSNGELLTGENWPEANNLETETVTLQSTGASCKRSIVIPIGTKKNTQQKATVQLGIGVLDKPIDLEYTHHAVDLAQVITVWKAQGATLKRVVLNLEPLRSTAPKWGFEHIYVGLSRVTTVDKLRCMPLSGSFREKKLRDLRPNIYTTRWRLDNQRSR